MTNVNDNFINDLKDILNEEWETDNRAKWKDGGIVQTKRIIQSVNKYDLSQGFPILNLREINFKAAIDEIICFYMKKSNNVKDMNSKIWNSWANENGEIKNAYGYQIAKPTMGYNSQIEYVIGEIKRNPTSRRIMMNMFNVEDQQIKATESLVECAYATHFSVKNGKLHMTLIQRSGDFMTAAGFGGWNTVQYAFLQHAIAQECGLKVGVFMHIVQDLHLYNRHINQAEEMIKRHEMYPIEIGDSYSLDPLPAPQIKIADKPFFELTADDVELVGYINHGKIGRLEVAI